MKFCNLEIKIYNSCYFQLDYGFIGNNILTKSRQPSRLETQSNVSKCVSSPFSQKYWELILTVSLAKKFDLLEALKERFSLG